ncbi:hypothetical protein UVI_02009380 [Ustilaginoidea virens]|uniref:Rhamnogalacturonase A/B/Epimerase-like pectate lyase domain-containing protein n=1 Tax=Ustilaginoidea virens TaxID=1159556 RepID=A0A1B5KUE2_USTVR|nr:hypothetical protein UVI_02009380 [Ustilaginoidea virens]
MGDLVFTDVTIGIRCGNQQFTSHSLLFYNVGIAVDLLWDWGWTWKNIYMVNTDVGFYMTGDYKGGSMMVLDSHFEVVNLGISINTNKGATDAEQFSITLENIIMNSVRTMVIHGSSNSLLKGGSSTIESWISGRVYDDDNPEGAFVNDRKSRMAEREPSLVRTNIVATDGYYIRSKPQYETKSPDFFLSARALAKGDGVSDDTFALTVAAAIAKEKGQALYIPMGSYIVTETVVFPAGSVIVGECWAQIVAKGKYFEDASNPLPAVAVGNYGETGSMEIQDLLLTVQGPTAGAVLMEWNIAQDIQGSAAMWGPPDTWKNIWAWVADHELDGGPSQTQIDIYAARESPYYLPDPQAPEPFKDTARFVGDPDFNDCHSSNPHCAAAWGLSIISSTNVRIYGAGLYNWFQRYTQQCVDTQDCQQRVVKVKNSGQIWMYNIYTIGTVEMINHGDDKPVLAKDNTNTNEHPFTSVVNGWLRASTGQASSDGDDDDDKDDDEDYGTLNDCNGWYDTLEQIQSAYNSIPSECINKYLAKAFHMSLTSSMKNYDKIMQNDYHSKFKVYHDLVEVQSRFQIRKYMLDDKAEGWHCEMSQHRKCCDQCAGGGGYLDDICFHLDCFGPNQGSPTKCSSGKSKVVPCPTSVGDLPDALTWVLDDKEKYFSNLEKNYGVLRDWVKFEDLDVYNVYGCVWFQHEDDPQGLERCQNNSDTFWRNFPDLQRNFKLEDPSEVIKTAHDKTANLLTENEMQMRMAEFALIPWADVANTLALPAMSMNAAVKNMEGIVRVANKKIEEDRQQGIAAIITAVLFFIPFVGEVAGAIGVTVLRTIIDLAGAFADIGYSIYDSVKNPDNVLSNMFGIIFAAGGMRGAFKAASAEWRALKQDKIEQLPSSFHKDVTAMRKMQASCKL